MNKSDYLTDVLQRALGDTSTKVDTLKKLYSRTKLFTLEDIERAYNEGKNNVLWKNWQ